MLNGFLYMLCVLLGAISQLCGYEDILLYYLLEALLYYLLLLDQQSTWNEARVKFNSFLQMEIN